MKLCKTGPSAEKKVEKGLFEKFVIKMLTHDITLPGYFLSLIAVATTLAVKRRPTNTDPRADDLMNNQHKEQK